MSPNKEDFCPNIRSCEWCLFWESTRIIDCWLYCYSGGNINRLRSTNQCLLISWFVEAVGNISHGYLTCFGYEENTGFRIHRNVTAGIPLDNLYSLPEIIANSPEKFHGFSLHSLTWYFVRLQVCGEVDPNLISPPSESAAGFKV